MHILCEYNFSKSPLPIKGLSPNTPHLRGIKFQIFVNFVNPAFLKRINELRDTNITIFPQSRFSSFCFKNSGIKKFTQNLKISSRSLLSNKSIQNRQYFIFPNYFKRAIYVFLFDYIRIIKFNVSCDCVVHAINNFVKSLIKQFYVIQINHQRDILCAEDIFCILPISRQNQCLNDLKLARFWGTLKLRHQDQRYFRAILSFLSTISVGHIL